MLPHMHMDAVPFLAHTIHRKYGDGDDQLEFLAVKLKQPAEVYEHPLMKIRFPVRLRFKMDKHIGIRTPEAGFQQQIQLS
ncbi:hypothetical protein D3C75_1078760 [compost metagenome]